MPRARFLSAGQSVVEILVGIAIGTIFIVGAAAVIAPSLRINQQTSIVQAKTELVNEMINNVKAWGGNWNSVLSLATGTTHAYYVSSTLSSFTIISSTFESISVASTTYNRFFYVSDVYRDSNGSVTSTVNGNNYDPSTKLVTISVSLASSTASPTTTISFYLTRNASNNFNQISWGGGSGEGNALSLATTTYASGTAVTITASGSIQLSSGGNTCTL
jgi:hypothetical protein